MKSQSAVNLHFAGREIPDLWIPFCDSLAGNHAPLAEQVRHAVFPALGRHGLPLHPELVAQEIQHQLAIRHMALGKNRVFVCPVSFRTQKKATAAIRIPEAVRADSEQKVVHTDIVKAPGLPFPIPGTAALQQVQFYNPIILRQSPFHRLAFLCHYVPYSLPAGIRPRIFSIFRFRSVFGQGIRICAALFIDRRQRTGWAVLTHFSPVSPTRCQYQRQQQTKQRCRKSTASHIYPPRLFIHSLYI